MGSAAERKAADEIARATGETHGKGRMPDSIAEVSIQDSIAESFVESRRPEAPLETENRHYQALIRLFERDRSRLLRVALRITRNQAEAEDVLQDAALRALLKLHSFRGDSRLDTWVYAIVSNVAISRLRRPCWLRECPLDDVTPDWESSSRGGHAESHHSGEEYLVGRQYHEIVHSEIGRLKSSYRSAVRLCDLEGYTYVEAAGILHLNLPNFKARLLRGRRTLRNRLRERMLGCNGAG
jgi:RNA polymerase sigma-70 factor (ECF subfamily)